MLYSLKWDRAPEELGNLSAAKRYGLLLCAHIRWIIHVVPRDTVPTFRQGV